MNNLSSMSIKRLTAFSFLTILIAAMLYWLYQKKQERKLGINRNLKQFPPVKETIEASFCLRSEREIPLQRNESGNNNSSLRFSTNSSQKARLPRQKPARFALPNLKQPKGAKKWLLYVLSVWILIFYIGVWKLKSKFVLTFMVNFTILIIFILILLGILLKLTSFLSEFSQAGNPRRFDMVVLSIFRFLIGISPLGLIGAIISQWEPATNSQIQSDHQPRQTYLKCPNCNHVQYLRFENCLKCGFPSMEEINFHNDGIPNHRIEMESLN